MSCPRCEGIERSHKEKPFCPPGGYKSEGNNTFKCSCGQRWYCYNDFYCLWGRVNDELTWKFLINNVVEVPISVGGVCVIAPGYEKYAIDPVHKICGEKNIRPKVKLEPAQGDIAETVVFQWLGEYDRGNIFNYQFAFPILAPMEKYLDRLDSFQIPFIGQIRNWPNIEQRSDLAETFKDPKEEKYIVCLMSPDYSREYGIGDLGPISFVAGIVLLADPNVGVIRPAYFSNPHITDLVNDKFKDKLSQGRTIRA